MSEAQARTKWGRAKVGRGQIPAMKIAIPCGLMLGSALGMVAVWAGIAGPNPLIGGAAFVLCFAVPATMLVWALLVDRSTLQGAPNQPEESIESGWYQRAAAGTQTDVIMAAVIGVLVLSLVPSGSSVDPRFVLGGVIGVSFLSFAIRYQLLRLKA